LCRKRPIEVGKHFALSTEQRRKPDTPEGNSESTGARHYAALGVVPNLRMGNEETEYMNGQRGFSLLELM